MPHKFRCPSPVGPGNGLHGGNQIRARQLGALVNRPENAEFQFACCN